MNKNRLERIARYYGHMIANVIIWVALAMVLSMMFKWNIWNILIAFTIAEVTGFKAKKYVDDLEIYDEINKLVKKERNDEKNKD